MSGDEVFQEVSKEDWLHQSEHFFILRAPEPLREGHLLIVSRQARKDFFELTNKERSELPEMIHEARMLIENAHVPEGYNIGMDCGRAAGQKFLRFHCHVIPRYGDEEEQKGSTTRGIANFLTR